MAHAADDPSPVDTRSASEIASETGDYTEFDRVVGQYLAEISGGRRRHRPTNPPGPPKCPECGHVLTGSVRPGSHGRPCMTVVADTADGRGIPDRCRCEWLPSEGSFQPERTTR